ncbi:hypothetical protein GCM10009759_74910 [Kitasatospora saccharophila]|uniref:Uncharacterized protein n=1 Tax=Kitasatospora saccharophila TaxID=407973 RepID=A0ABP5K219_9ACTN
MGRALDGPHDPPVRGSRQRAPKVLRRMPNQAGNKAGWRFFGLVAGGARREVSWGRARNFRPLRAWAC